VHVVLRPLLRVSLALSANYKLYARYLYIVDTCVSVIFSDCKAPLVY